MKLALLGTGMIVTEVLPWGFSWDSVRILRPF